MIREKHARFGGNEPVLRHDRGSLTRCSACTDISRTMQWFSGSTFTYFWIRAKALRLAIPEHEISEQARRSKRKVGLDCSVALRGSHPDPSFLFLDPRLHMISALEGSQSEILEDLRSFCAGDLCDPD